MLGVDQVEVPWAIPTGAAEVVEDAPAEGVPIATAATLRAGTAAKAAGAVFD
jgi:hypothetical protein